MSDCYRWPRKHTVELNGGVTEFSSYIKDGFWLESEAVDAAKKAGLYKESADVGRMLLDGKPIRQ